MKTSDKGLELIKRYEGCVLKAYKCPAGVWTIGYGHTKTARPGMKITLRVAQELLQSDLQVFEEAVNSLVDIDVTQNEFDALVSFTYNVGSGALRQSTLLRVLNEGYKIKAANEFLKWTKAAGRTLPGLVARRSAERMLFLGDK